MMSGWRWVSLALLVANLLPTLIVKLKWLKSSLRPMIFIQRIESQSHSTVKHRYPERTSIPSGNSWITCTPLEPPPPPKSFSTQQVATYIFCFHHLLWKSLGTLLHALRFLLCTIKHMPYNPGFHFENNQTLFFLTSTKAYSLLFFLVVPRVSKRHTLLYIK